MLFRSLASSLAVKKPSSPLVISPCMGEPPVKLASSWQERAASCRATCRSAGERCRDARIAIGVGEMQEKLASLTGELKFNFFFIKRNNARLPYSCIPFFCLYPPHCIRFFSYSWFHCIFSSLGTTCSCKYFVN